MKINEYIQKIKKLSACGEAIEAAHRYKTSQELWDDCERGDWMLWLIGKKAGDPNSDSRKKLVLTACKCARLALKHIPSGETRPLKAIETAEARAKNTSGVSLQHVAYAAAYAAYVAAAAYVADAAAAAYAAAYAAYAYAAAAAADAAAAAARSKVLQECANIVREQYKNIDDLFV